MKTTSLSMALCLQIGVLLLAGSLTVRAAVTSQNQADDAVPHLAFYETHMSPMGWGAVLARSGIDAVSSLSSTGKATTALSPKWKAGWDPSTYNSKDRAAERAYLKPHTHITIKRPAGNWTTSKTKAARAYNNMRLRYRNPIYNSVRPGPAKFYMPGTIKQLIQTIKRLNKAGTRWVVRGGGHNYEATALPSGTGAAVIDMARFTQFRIASDAQSAIIGAGQRLGEVYLRLAQHNPPLLMVAGTCAANGASGYLLGGGAGVSSRKYGWGTEQVRHADWFSMLWKQSKHADGLSTLPSQSSLRSPLHARYWPTGLSPWRAPTLRTPCRASLYPLQTCCGRCAAAAPARPWCMNGRWPCILHREP